MANQWHYMKDGQNTGPVSPQQLMALAASGQLKPTDMVWREGLTDWIAASKIKELFPQPAPVAPPPPPATNRLSAPPQPSTGAPAASATVPKPSRLVWGLRATMVLVALLSLAPWYTINMGGWFYGDRGTFVEGTVFVDGLPVYNHFGNSAISYNLIRGSTMLGTFVLLFVMVSIIISFFRFPYSGVVVSVAVLLTLFLVFIGIVGVNPKGYVSETHVTYRMELEPPVWICLAVCVVGVGQAVFIYRKALMALLGKKKPVSPG